MSAKQDQPLWSVDLDNFDARLAQNRLQETLSIFAWITLFTHNSIGRVESVVCRLIVLVSATVAMIVLSQYDASDDREQEKCLQISNSLITLLLDETRNCDTHCLACL